MVLNDSGMMIDVDISVIDSDEHDSTEEVASFPLIFLYNERNGIIFTNDVMNM